MDSDKYHDDVMETVRKKMSEDKYRLSPEERKLKLSLKKGSVQLHGAIWDFIDSRSMAGIVSSASIVRGYVMNGVRIAIATEIKNLPSHIALKNVKRGILREFRRNLAEGTADINALIKGDHSKSPDAIFYNTDLTELLNYYENNPGEFEKAKDSISNSFLTIPDADLIEVLGEGDY